MYKCEKCGKEVTEKFGSGRFCSKSCANSRVRPQEVKDKISKTIKSHITYVNDVDGKLITEHRANIIEEKRKRKEQRLYSRGQLASEIDLKNSPYSEFDTAYMRSGSDKDCYYLTKHDSNNKIVKRAIVPIYRYIVEYNLKRKLSYNEVVHHKDGNHFNNDISNLEVMLRSLHNSHHHKKN